MKFTLSPRRIVQVLSLAVLCLTVASVAGQILKYFLGRPTIYGFVPLFNVDEEANFPTWYQSTTLLLCSILLATIQLSKRDGDRYVFHWRVMSLIFLWLSIDEATLIRDHSEAILERAFNPGGFFYYAWVIPAIPLVFIFMLAYLRFLFNLPAKTRRLFLIAGSLFVGGALGMELIGGRYREFHGYENMTYIMITHVEEVLEMIGVVVFIYALTLYMISPAKEVIVSVSWTEIGHEEPESETHSNETESHRQFVTGPR